MVPRARIESIGLEDDIGEHRAAARHQLPPAPAGVPERAGEMVGVLQLRKVLVALPAPARSTRTPARAAVREPYFVPASTPVLAQMQYFQENRERMALVVDEYGELMGLRDARGHPRGDHRQVHHLAALAAGALAWDRPTAATAEGSDAVREVNRALGLSLPTDGPKTLNGLIVEHLQDIPEADVVDQDRQRADGNRPRAGPRRSKRCEFSGRAETCRKYRGLRGLARRTSAFTKPPCNGHHPRSEDRRNLVGSTESRERDGNGSCGAPKGQRNQLHLGGQGQGRQDHARRDARRRRGRRSTHAAPAGHHGRQGQEAASAAAAARSREKDIALFTRQLATMMKAGVPLLQAFDIVGKGASQPGGGEAADRHQDRSRDRLRRSPRRSGSIRCTSTPCSATWCGAGEQAGILESAARPPRDVQGKDPRHQVEDQDGAVLSDRDHRGRVHHHRGDHDFRDPGVQAGVHELRRRPAGADADRDGDLGLLRRVLVHHLRRSSAAASTASSRRGSARWRCRSSWTGSMLQRAGVRRPGAQSRPSRAGRARCRPCSPPACRWSRRSTRSGGAAGNYVYYRSHQADPGRSLDRHQRSPWRCRTPNVFPNMVIQMVVDRRGNRRARRACSARSPTSSRPRSTTRSRRCRRLMEPMIMVVLGTLIGGMVIAMYLPIFKMGQAV